MDEKKIDISVNIDAVAEANILEKFFPVKSDGRVDDLDIFNIPPRSVSRVKQILSGEKESNEQTLKDVFSWARLSEKRRYEISEHGGLTPPTKQELFKICTKLQPTFKSYGLDLSLFDEEVNIADKVNPFIESFASTVARTVYSLGLLQLCVYEPLNKILTEEKNRLFSAKKDIQGEIGALHEDKAHLKRDIL